ncbi:MAG: hypothetical protein E7293_00010 [Lachnospiraceae bacterium]|nr:hypothetical protein [Lachnospiraceae bacterium]
MKRMMKIIMRVLMVTILCSCFIGCTTYGDGESSSVVENSSLKVPGEYTWEEYEALDDNDKNKFQKSFEDIAAFDSWLMKAQEDALLPWESGGKQPVEYTWEEYEALSDFLKDAFFESFEVADDFDMWMRIAMGGEALPWEDGGKQPVEYTWEEYETLSENQKMEFQKSFKDIVAFDNWLMGAQNNALLPWEEEGIQPSDYTWEEYEALSDFLKDTFFESFENVKDFDRWMTSAMESIIPPWENGGKQPSDYTWEEYELLNMDQQIEFQKCFEDINAFDNWLIEAQENAVLPWDDGGKQPFDYTWKEYEALTDFQKDAFFESFESISDFDNWYAANSPQ